MNMSHFPRLPVRFIAENSELLKSQEVGLNKSIDYQLTESVPEARMEPQFRAPGDRNLGNVLFRRNPDGSLDVEAAKHVVVDMIHKVKDQMALTELEKLVLGILFPLAFDFVDPRLAKPLTAVHLKLAPWEVMLIASKVSAHLIAEMNYNAGLGGGGDPGRATTRS